MQMHMKILLRFLYKPTTTQWGEDTHKVKTYVNFHFLNEINWINKKAV